jgi:hypothetical protein
MRIAGLGSQLVWKNHFSCSHLRAAYPANDSLPFTFRTWRGLQSAKSGPIAAWAQAHFYSQTGSAQGSFEVANREKFFVHKRIDNDPVIERWFNKFGQ